MKTISNLILAITMMVMTSCYFNEDFGPKNDPGKLQEDDRIYSITGFNRVEAGDALDVTVTQGAFFSVTAYGDTRNLDDLEVEKVGSTLVFRFDRNFTRQYTTFIEIVMPDVKGIDFGGAVHGVVNSFTSASSIDLTLSGASNTSMNVDATQLVLKVSGASKLNLTGEAHRIEGIISGASLLTAIEFPVSEAKFTVSGASEVRVNVSDNLIASLSGASHLSYLGNPQIQSTTSGASQITRY
jgi:hypothetical protein